MLGEALWSAQYISKSRIDRRESVAMEPHHIEHVEIRNHLLQFKP